MKPSPKKRKKKKRYVLGVGYPRYTLHNLDIDRCANIRLCKDVNRSEDSYFPVPDHSEVRKYKLVLEEL